MGNRAGRLNTLALQSPLSSVISLAYLEDGYSEIEIVNHSRLSKSAVSMLIKNGKSGDLTVGMLGLYLLQR